MNDGAVILFFNKDVKYGLRNKKHVRETLRRIFSDFGCNLSFLNYIFCNDEFLYNMNVQILKHATLTDIITLDYSDGEKIKGEAYISIDRLRDNAKIFKTSFYKETLRVMIHGALHLVGLNDKSENEKAEMRKKEDYYLGEFFRSFTASS